MAVYNYDDVMNRMAETGISLTGADLALAKKFPDAAYGILEARKGWSEATTPEQKQYFHDYAEGIRKQYGYSGGDAGDQFLVDTEQTPSDYDLGTYESPYAGKIASALDSVLNTSDYQSQYADQINNILSGNYDVSQNPVYQATVKTNRREAARAAEDALGSAAAMTGGMASSYASTAASQAANYQNAKTTDAIPTIIANTLSGLQTQDNTTYQQYLDALGLDQNKLTALETLDNSSRDQYNTEKALGYQQFTDNLTYKSGRDDAANTQSINEKSLAQNNTEMKMQALGSLYEQTSDPKYLQQLLDLMNS